MAETKQAATATEPLGFDYHTRHNQRHVATLNYDGSVQQLSLELPRIGLLSKVYLVVNGSFTLTHASKTSVTKRNLSPYYLFRRVRLSLNSGTDLVNVSGYGLFIENELSTFNHSTDSDTYLTTLGNTVSSAGTSNNIAFVLEVPIALNDRDNLAYLLLQNPETLATLTLDFNTINSLYTDASDVTVSNISIDVAVVTEFFNVPVLPQNYPPLNFLFQTLENSKEVKQVGEQIIDILRGNTIVKLFGYVLFDNVRQSDSVIDKHEFRYNQTEVPYAITHRGHRAIYSQGYGKVLPSGLFVFDFNHQGLPDLGTARDYINTEFLTDIQYRLTIDTSAVLGTTNSINYIVQQLVKLS